MIDMGVEPFLVSSALNCVISQRLVRRLNEKTKRKMQPSAELVARLGITQQEAAGMTFYEAVPSDTPGDTGYQGRLAIHEVMLVDEDIARLVIDGADANTLKDLAIKKGMVPLALDGVRCIGLGITSPEEVLSVSYIEEAVEKEEKKADEGTASKPLKKV
jgi:type II secretory ATPase GspE/PulE/Tfp pilus assembly ATPase PilB-like protein